MEQADKETDQQRLNIIYAEDEIRRQEQRMNRIYTEDEMRRQERCRREFKEDTVNPLIEFEVDNGLHDLILEMQKANMAEDYADFPPMDIKDIHNFRDLITPEKEFIDGFLDSMSEVADDEAFPVFYKAISVYVFKYGGKKQDSKEDLWYNLKKVVKYMRHMEMGEWPSQLFTHYVCTKCNKRMSMAGKSKHITSKKHKQE
jgi:hypothetical protein